MQPSLRLVVDENIEHIAHYFAPLGLIYTAKGRDIDNAMLKSTNANVLLTRSVTEVNSDLLAGTDVGFVGTATIGVNHVDLAYLAAKHIAFASAAGCNAEAVAQYVLTAIAALKPHALVAEQQFAVGIVGMGNVGARLCALASRLGWQIHAYDPLLSDGRRQQLAMHWPAIHWHSKLVALLPKVDALSVHVPLTTPSESAYATLNLIGATELSALPKHAMLVNTCRGGVLNENALIDDYAHTQRDIVLDVFCHEPTPSAQLLACAAIATPHVAGYSLEGKVQGSRMVAAALYAYLGRNDLPPVLALLAMPQLMSATESLYGASLGLVFQSSIAKVYNIRQDHDSLLATLAGKTHVAAPDFDRLRKQYRLRREWAAYGFI
jgi:erythronate-4-phosphate dehydrogenase